MKKRRVSLIAAMGSNRAIGIDGDLPWRLPADLRQFKFPGDTFFPEFDESARRLVGREDHEATAETPFAYGFRVYDRVPGDHEG